MSEEPEKPKKSFSQYNKLTAAGLGGALSTIGVWVWHTYVDPDVTIPNEVAMAIATIFSSIAVLFAPANKS